MPTKSKILLAVFALLVPQMLWANAGTPLMWFTAFYLFFANLSLGIIEGIILAVIGKNKYLKSILLAILANFVSFIAGYAILEVFQAIFTSLIFDLKGLYSFWIVSLSILYFVTVYVEAYFFSLAYPKTVRSYIKTLKMSYFINIVSYIGMIVGFFTYSNYSFLSDLEVNQAILDKKYDFELYVYHDHQILADTLSNEFNGSLIKQISEEYSRMYFKLVKDTLSNKLTLTLEENRYDDKNRSVMIQKDFLPKEYRCRNGKFADFNLTQRIDFRESNKEWDIRYNKSWAANGFTIRYLNRNKAAENFALEVPWMSWVPDEFTILNNKEMLFLIGGRLVLMNIETKEIAYITRANSYAIRKLE